jgi:isoleucyl-tRNA synthetase
MSKRKGNAIDPFGAIETFGSDPLRWYMISNASPWENLKFDTDGVIEVSRKFFGTLFNTYKLFALYANIDGFTGQEPEVALEQRPEIDRWILSSLNTLIKGVESNLENYEPTIAGRLIETFVCDNLSNWYVRLNRKRFWGGEMNDDKLAAYQTLYTCLETVAKLMAPIAPFYSDKLFLDLNAVSGRDKSESVHLSTFPKTGETEAVLERKMQLAQTVTSLILSIRKTSQINVRQPLQTVLFPAVDAEQAADIEDVKDLILSETNIKELKIAGSDSHVLVKKVKPNFRELGKRYGKLMKPLAATLGSLEQEKIAELENTGKLSLLIEGTEVEITSADVEIISEDMPGWSVASEGRVTVALDVTVTEELRKEGVARELIKRIQNYRKEAGFEVTDRIQIVFEPNEKTDAVVEQFKDYIAGQVLATSISIGAVGADATKLPMADYEINVSITK